MSGLKRKQLDLQLTTVKTSNYSANEGEMVLCDTSGGSFTVTLPATPRHGKVINITDVNSSFSDTNKLIVNPNGNNIVNQATPFDLVVKQTSYTFVYVTGKGWLLLDQAPSGVFTGNLATGSVAFVGNGGLITEDNANFFFDNTNNYLGLGTNTPSTSLDLTGKTDSIRIPVGTTAQRNGTPLTGMIRYNTSLTQFEGYTNAWQSLGGDLVEFTVNQNAHGFTVGQVVQMNAGVWSLAIANSSTTLGVGVVSFIVDVNNFKFAIAGKLTGLAGLTAGEYYFVSDTLAGTITSTEPASYSNPVGLAVSTTELLILPYRPSITGIFSNYTNGAVAFGNGTPQLTTNPTKLFWNDTNRTLNIVSDAGQTGIDVYNTAGNTIRLGKLNGNAALALGSQTTDFALIESINGGGLQMYTGNGALSKQLVITSSGCVGIGSYTPSHSLEVVTSDTLGTGTTSVQIVNQSVTTPYGVYIGFTGASPNNTSQYYFYCPDNSGLRFVVWSNGSVQNATGSYGILSDVKLKENIVDATPKLDKLLQIRVVNYNLINDPNKFKLIGFVAQELELVMPGLVDDTEQTVLVDGKPVLDENGKEIKEIVKAVKSTVFVPIIIKAMQEQQAIIESQKTEIENLKAIVDSLVNRIQTIETKVGI